MTPKSSPKRGYAVAILVGFDEKNAFVWRIYSKVAKLETTVSFEGTRTNPKNTYSFHEALINSLRDILKEGVRSIILVSPPRTTYAQMFTAHIASHHAWLTQGRTKVTLAEMAGLASRNEDVAFLARKPEFHRIIQETTAEETENLLQLLEKHLNSPSKSDVVVYSLEDVEYVVNYSTEGKTKPEFLMITDKFLANSRQKGRLNRLIQIAAAQRIKTRVVNSDLPAGKKLAQLGGIVLIAKKE